MIKEPSFHCWRVDFEELMSSEFWCGKALLEGGY